MSLRIWPLKVLWALQVCVSRCYANIKQTRRRWKKCVCHILVYQSMSTVHLRLSSILDWKGTSSSVKQCMQYWPMAKLHICVKKLTCSVFTVLYDERIIFSWCSIKMYLKLCFSFMYKENHIFVCITFDMLLNYGGKVPAKVHWKFTSQRKFPEKPGEKYALYPSLATHLIWRCCGPIKMDCNLFV